MLDTSPSLSYCLSCQHSPSFPSSLSLSLVSSFFFSSCYYVPLSSSLLYVISLISRNIILFFLYTLFLSLPCYFSFSPHHLFPYILTSTLSLLPLYLHTTVQYIDRKRSEVYSLERISLGKRMRQGEQMKINMRVNEIEKPE